MNEDPTRAGFETPATSTASPAVAARPSSRSLFWSIFPSIMLPMFLAVADQTIVATALPSMASDLGEVERVSWVVVSYLIANTIAAPVYGRLGDSFGRKPMMLTALFLFMLGSVLCAFAPNIEFLTATRVLQGFGGGGLMTLSQALVGETIPPRERGRYQGYLAGVSVASSTFGPVAGGYLTQAFGWRSIFWVNVPLGLVAVFMVMRLQTQPGDWRRTSFDAPGLLLFMMFVSPVILALEEAQRMDARTLPIILGLAAFGTLALVLLIWQEKHSASPLIPPALFREPSVWRADALAACHGASLVSLITFLPIYLRAVRGATPAETGLLLLPLMFGIGKSHNTGRLSLPKVKANGITINYEQQGAGEPLVLIPFLAADNACYAFQVADYAKHFTCISIDPRGAGETDKPAGAYSMELFSDDIAALMQAIGVERAHVSGLSLGAATGLWLAGKYPQRVKSLSLHSGWTKSDPFLKTVVEGWPSIAGGLGDVTEMVIQGIFPWCFTPGLYAAKPDYIDQLAAFVRSRPKQPGEAFVSQSSAVIAHDAMSQSSPASRHRPRSLSAATTWCARRALLSR